MVNYIIALKVFNLKLTQQFLFICFKADVMLSANYNYMINNTHRRTGSNVSIQVTTMICLQVVVV